jgi:hypothetical protein
MHVDQALIDTAERLLRATFPGGPGQACAAYSRDGDIYIGTSMTTGSDLIDAEANPVFEAARRGELIAALVTVGWEGPGSPVVARVPRAKVLRDLQSQARRHAQIATSGSVTETVVVRPLWELTCELDAQYNSNTALAKGHFGHGMKSIGGELEQFARDTGVFRTRAEFSDILVTALKCEKIRASASSVGAPGSKFLTPTRLDSVSLRHVWLAFELAAEQFTFDLVDSFRNRLSDLGGNEADIVHIKQGLEALRNIFSVLVVLTGTRLPVLNESPFYPYDSSVLHTGTPIHRYIRFDEIDEVRADEPSVRNNALIQQLVRVLANRGYGGFTSYIRQRGLFRVDLFDGGGPGHCPFSAVSNEIIYSTASGLERALREEVVILAPNS